MQTYTGRRFFCIPFSINRFSFRLFPRGMRKSRESIPTHVRHESPVPVVSRRPAGRDCFSAWGTVGKRPDSTRRQSAAAARIHRLPPAAAGTTAGPSVERHRGRSSAVLGGRPPRMQRPPPTPPSWRRTRLYLLRYEMLSSSTPLL